MENNLTVQSTLRYFDDLRGRRSDWDYVCRLAERLELPVLGCLLGTRKKVSSTLYWLIR